MGLLHYLFIIWIIILIFYFRDNLLYKTVKEIKTVKCFVEEKRSFSKEYPIIYSNMGFYDHYEPFIFTKEFLSVHLTKNYNLIFPKNTQNKVFFNKIKKNDDLILKIKCTRLIPRFNFSKSKSNEEIVEVTALTSGHKLFL